MTTNCVFKSHFQFAYNVTPSHLPADDRSAWRKTADRVLSIFKDIFYFLAVQYHRISSPLPPSIDREIIEKPGSQGLVVLLHGLYASPGAWFPHLDLLKDKPGIDVFAPAVPKLGVCSLEEAGRPLLAVIENYAKKYPGKPICLLGISNGSRIATWLETQLRQSAPQSAALVSTIAGVHRGSSRIDLLDSFHVPDYFYPRIVRQELCDDSQTSQRLLDKVRAPLPAGCSSRFYVFYASTEDLLVPNLASSLPQIGENEECIVLHGEGHGSILWTVAEEQIEHCQEWISHNQPINLTESNDTSPSLQRNQ